MRGVAVTLACFTLVASLLAWSRWLARRRVASVGHATLAAVCAALAAVLWAATDGLAGFEPLQAGMAIAEIRFDPAGPGHYRATLVRLPQGRVQVFEMTGERWRIEARTLEWQGPAASAGLRPSYRLERIESGPDAGTATGASAARSYALASGAGMDVWALVRGHPAWSRYAEAGDSGTPWEPIKGGAEFAVVVQDRRLVVEPAGPEAPGLAPPRR